jgi:hypothetical protein
MARDKDDIIRDIGQVRADRRGDGDGGYTGGYCVYCDGKLERGEGSEKVIDIYDLHWKCYDPDPDWDDRLKFLLYELEREIKKEWKYKK